jgi:two-component system LytT family response regulator
MTGTGIARIKTLIVDDETLARRRIRRLLATESDVEVVGECGDSQKAVSFIQERNPDLVFLDIQMPGIDGFGVLESLAPQQTPAVIFITAFDQYALRAFEVHALDYLLKPFDRARFKKALDRARAQIRHDSGESLDHRLTTLLDSLGNKPRHMDRVVIKSAGRIMFLRTDEIDWIEAADNYVRLHVGAESHLLRETMGALESRLDASRFMRIHRSTVVNIDRMKELQPWFHGDYVVILQDGTRLNLSRTYRDRVIELLGEIF